MHLLGMVFLLFVSCVILVVVWYVVCIFFSECFCLIIFYTKLN